MHTLRKIYCRTFQTVFKIALPFLPYRTPEIVPSVKKLPEIIRANLLNGWTDRDEPGVPKDEMISILKPELERLRDDLAAALGAVKQLLGELGHGAA